MRCRESAGRPKITDICEAMPRSSSARGRTTIVPVHPAFIPVPYYDPAIVFFPPEPGIVIGGAIRFDFFVTIGEFFRPWGWGYCRFDWDSHVVIINNAPWRRTWINRREYVHPYEGRQYRTEERLPDRHVLH